MVLLLGQTIHFWTAFIAGIFILLHIPSCDVHWANRLKPLSDFLSRYHGLTLKLAAIFALVHIILSLIGLISRIWV